jgi:NADH dehydrogenase
MTTVTVFGGSGFLGRRLVERLAAEGMDVRVAVRHVERVRSLADAGPGRIAVVRADVRDASSVAAAVAGAHGAVNAVSAYLEKGDVTFRAVHEEGAETVAREAAAAGVERLVLISGIGAEPESRSPYIRARGEGERRVRAAFPGATVVRPGAMFGPGDALFAGVADLARLLPALPLIGGGGTRLQPVYVGDVAQAIVYILAKPETAGRIYEFAGPTIYTLRALIELALRASGRRRLLIPLPFVLADIQARLFELLPSPPLTTGQVDLLRLDNVARGDLPGLQDLGIVPTPAETVVPTYLGPARRQG